MSRSPHRVAGSLAHLVIDSIRRTARPDVTVVPPPAGIVTEWNVPIELRDGTILRANVFRPESDQPVPVIMCAHPYNKDKIPANTRSGKAVPMQYRVFKQPDRVQFSAWTSWEAPDPGFWVSQGYCAVNVDLRGGGSAEGRDVLFSAQEADDYAQAIEWAGTQPWSSGKVGLCGVSYLAISQYRVAALRPPHLAAICPWEGFSDLYRDFVRPGGVRETGFSIVWAKGIKRGSRVEGDMAVEIRNRAERDAWYQDRTPRLEDIEVPMLVCGSFSDQNLHTRGSFEAFRRAGSEHKWLYTHRSGKWSTFYSEEAKKTKTAFFDWALKGLDNGWADRPPVRLAVYGEGPDPCCVSEETAWPPADAGEVNLHLDLDGSRLSVDPPSVAQARSVHLPHGSLRLTWTVPEDLDLVGPMALRVYLRSEAEADPFLFVGVRSFRGEIERHFEGSYGFARDMVTHGSQRAAFRDLDPELSTPLVPVHTYLRPRPLKPGEVVPVDIALLPQATRFRRGDELRLDLQGRWFFSRNPVTGQFPVGYARSPEARVQLLSGPETPARLRLLSRSIS